MHELFQQVLKNRDLSRAGDLFSIRDSLIVNDLTEVLKEITTIASLAGYAHNNNDQSVVEICVTRVTSCIRETGSVEKHCDALVTLLESCLHHNLQVSSRGEDPPHAKISSDLISCIFLNYGKKTVMQKALPIAVKFLHKGNQELFRNMASYLSLAAIEHATLLSPHVQPIMDSIISGNYPLCRVLSQIYEVSPELLQGHAMALVSLLSYCEIQEKLALLHLFALIAKDNPTLLEASIPQLCEYLNNSLTVSQTLQVFLNMAETKPALLADNVNAIKQAAQIHPPTLCLAAQVVGAIGKLSKARAQDALNFVLEYLPKADRGSQSTLLREATLLCSSYPALFTLFTDKVLAGVRKQPSQVNHQATPPTPVAPASNSFTSGGVTIVKVGGHAAASTTPQSGYARRAKLGDSRSTGRLHTASHSNTHRSMTRLNITGGSVGGLHKSMTRLSSSQQINAILNHGTQKSDISNSNANNLTIGGGHLLPPQLNCTNKWTVPKVLSGGVTVTTILPPSQPRMVRPLMQGTLQNSITTPTSTSHVIITSSADLKNGQTNSSITVNSVYSGAQINVLTAPTLCNHSAIGQPEPVNITGPSTVTSRRSNNTSVTLLNANPTSQRMSVFEPYPMRDTIQHFCEKHLDKIKTYMDNVTVRIPPPAKCTIEEKRQKKSAKLHFGCQARGQHCLYTKTFFTMRTRNPRIWIHLMFIALQAKSPHALSSRDASVTSLKHCWDMLKCENKTFLTLVTSAFPCAKDQDTLLSELRHSGFFDVFQLTTGMNASADQLNDNQPLWGCFLCAHPERAVGFLRGDTAPVIEGQLKEKKGRWRLFRRWRTRYFTLSGAHLSCRGSSGGESIDVNQIRSVKVSRGARNIPKAFEIFTGNQTLILKPKDGKNAEEWVQCLSIVVAHSHAKERPGKSNSLPARGISTSRQAI